MDRKIARVQPFACPGCGKRVDSMSHPDGKTLPRNGDLGVCLTCAEVHIFKAGRLLALSDDELISLTVNEKKVLSLRQQTVREFNKQKKS